MSITFPVVPAESEGYATLEDLASHAGDCPNIAPIDERLRAVEGEVVVARFAGYNIQKSGGGYLVTLSFTGDTTEGFIFTYGSDYTPLIGIYVAKSSITTYSITLTPAQVEEGTLFEMKREIDVAIMYQLVVDAALVGAGEGSPVTDGVNDWIPVLSSPVTTNSAPTDLTEPIPEDATDIMVVASRSISDRNNIVSMVLPGNTFGPGLDPNTYWGQMFIQSAQPEVAGVSTSQYQGFVQFTSRSQIVMTPASSNFVVLGVYYKKSLAQATLKQIDDSITARIEELSAAAEWKYAWKGGSAGVVGQSVTFQEAIPEDATDIMIYTKSTAMDSLSTTVVPTSNLRFDIGSSLEYVEADGFNTVMCTTGDGYQNQYQICVRFDSRYSATVTTCMNSYLLAIMYRKAPSINYPQSAGTFAGWDSYSNDTPDNLTSFNLALRFTGDVTDPTKYKFGGYAQTALYDPLVIYVPNNGFTQFSCSFPMSAIEDGKAISLALSRVDGNREILFMQMFTKDLLFGRADVAAIQQIVDDGMNEIKAVIPAVASSTNKLISASELQTGLNGVYVPGAMIYRGVLDNSSLIQAVVSPSAGDYYQAEDTGMFWIYNGAEWQATTNMVDLTGYYTKPEVETLIGSAPQKFEDEIKKILDEYAAEHGGDLSEWTQLWGGMGETATLTTGLDVLQATEVMVVVRQSGTSTGAPFATGMTVFPITNRFAPGADPVFGPTGVAYNAGGVSYSNNGDAGIVMFQFTDYKTITKIYGPSGSTLCGVLYRSVKPNAVISYYKDPTIVAANEPDYSQRVPVSVPGFIPYTLTVNTATDGVAYIAEEDCFLSMRNQITLSVEQATSPVFSVKIGGSSVIVSSPAVQFDLSSRKSFKWDTPLLFVEKGQSVQLSLSIYTQATLTINVNEVWYYKTKGAILDATEEAFNGHVQNTDIHFAVDEKAGVLNSISTTTDDLNTLEASFSHHTTTDRFRWSDFYSSQLDMYVEMASSQGLKPDYDNTENVTQGTVYAVTNPYGGLLTVKALNSEGFFTTVAIVGKAGWNSDGLIEGVSVTKYFRLQTGDQVQVDNAQSVTFIPATEDPDNPVRVALARMEASVAESKQAILDMQAGLANKKASGIKQDIANETFTVTNSLGGRLTGKGLNLLLGSTGTVSITNAQGTTEVYNNAGLLSLLDPVPVLVKDVVEGDIITSSGMGELSYEDYIAG